MNRPAHVNGRHGRGLFLLLAIVSLVVGAIGIANVTFVTVMERTCDIGLRRALGARNRHIATQFLGESGVIGLIGGVIGASIGLIRVSGRRSRPPRGA